MVISIAAITMIMTVVVGIIFMSAWHYLTEDVIVLYVALVVVLLVICCTVLSVKVYFVLREVGHVEKQLS